MDREVIVGCQDRFPPAQIWGQTLAQPEGLSPQSPGLTRSRLRKGGILVDFQAGELVSPATKLYIQF